MTLSQRNVWCILTHSSAMLDMWTEGAANRNLSLTTSYLAFIIGSTRLTGLSPLLLINRFILRYFVCVVCLHDRLSGHYVAAVGLCSRSVQWLDLLCNLGEAAITAHVTTQF